VRNPWLRNKDLNDPTLSASSNRLSNSCWIRTFSSLKLSTSFNVFSFWVRMSKERASKRELRRKSHLVFVSRVFFQRNSQGSLFELELRKRVKKIYITTACANLPPAESSSVTHWLWTVVDWPPKSTVLCYLSLAWVLFRGVQPSDQHILC